MALTASRLLARAGWVAARAAWGQCLPRPRLSRDAEAGGQGASFPRCFAGQVVQARKALGKERLPVIGLHASATPTPPCRSPTGCRSRSCRSASDTPAPPSRSPSTSTCAPAWAARQPSASPRSSRADPWPEVSRGYQEAAGASSCERPGLLTCRSTGARECPRGDTLHTHTALASSRSWAVASRAAGVDVGAVRAADHANEHLIVVDRVDDAYWPRRASEQPSSRNRNGLPTR